VTAVSDKVVRHLLAYLPVQKWLVGDVPLLRENFVENGPPPSKTPIFTRQP